MSLGDPLQILKPHVRKMFTANGERMTRRRLPLVSDLVCRMALLLGSVARLDSPPKEIERHC